MNVTLNLKPEVEKGLKARAHSRGVSLGDYLQELIARDAGLPIAAGPSPVQKQPDNRQFDSLQFDSLQSDNLPFDNLSDLLLNSPLAGADLDLERSKDDPRPVDLA
jgi:hypothetical protein